MTGLHRYKSFLRKVNPNTASDSQHTEDIVLPDKSIVIGRDPSCCDIVLHPTKYQEVSRQHLKISLLSSQSPSHMPEWEICDLGSRNGTYVNGQRLQGSQILQVNDQIKLGRNGPEFIFECEQITFISVSAIFPAVSKNLDLHQKGLLVPGIVTVIFVVAMLATQKELKVFSFILAAYLALASHYVIHKLCHKHKPWWLLVSLGLATALPFLSSDFHHFLKPPHDSHQYHNIKDILAIIPQQFLKAGLFEELFKVLPVILVYIIGRLLQSPKRELIGIWEPMDGILLATASATGFALVETMLEVYPKTNERGAGLPVLIPLILGDIFGQVAYSGYFGYFIGLGAMKPRKLWQFIGIGYLTSATVHTIAATIVKLREGDNNHRYLLILSVLSALIGFLAYRFLMAAIVKANQLSPNHSHKSANG